MAPVSADGDLRGIFACKVTDSGNNQASYSFAKEVADDFRHYHGRELESEVAKIIESDVQAGIL